MHSKIYNQRKTLYTSCVDQEVGRRGSGTPSPGKLKLIKLIISKIVKNMHRAPDTIIP